SGQIGADEIFIAVETCLQILVVSFGNVRRRLLKRALFRRRDLYCQSLNDAGCKFILELKHFSALQVVTLCPLRRPCLCIDELQGDAYDSGRTLVGAVENRLHAEVFCRLHRICALLHIFQNRTCRADGKVVQRGEAADDGVCHADSPTVTSSLPGKIAEWENGHSLRRTCSRGGSGCGARRCFGSAAGEEVPSHDNQCQCEYAQPNTDGNATREIKRRRAASSLRGQELSRFCVAL